MSDEDKAETAAVQAKYRTLSQDALNSDPVLSFFKKGEIDASVTAASSGAYHSFWSVDKIAELNNQVDSQPNCPEKLKNLFGPGTSRNPRIRGNRIGQLIFDQVKEIVQGGGVSLGAEGDVAPAAAVPIPAKPAAAAAERMLDGLALQIYAFSSDLPADCQLRVRAEPSMDGEALGTVTNTDVIKACPTVVAGDWLRVQIAGWAHEAWMLTQMGGQQLLVPQGVGANNNAVTVPAAQVLGGAPALPMEGNRSAPMSPTSQRSASSVGAGPMLSMASLSGAPTPTRPLTMQSMHAPSTQAWQPPPQMSMSMNGSQHGNMSMAMEGQPVPYELYRRLEVRVNHLEQELNNLKMCLRSV
eukprot:m.459883 g.459883  ORF g.459883 m.459883 type:complete len:356 (-) comp21585_c1_seq1:703-1770(-)